MNRELPPVYDEKRSPEENSARALFRLCSAVERIGGKIDEVRNELVTIRHAMNANTEALRTKS